eukprot:gene25297-28597_t
MYGTSSNSGAANMSPRSKMISLGLSAVDAPPVRYRPPVKAADFPFTNSPNRNNDANYEKAYEPYDYKYDNGDNDYYEPSPAPSEDLRSQYTEFQKKLIAEQASGNFDHNYSQYDERAKALSLGQSYQGGAASVENNREKAVAKYAEYQKRVEADQSKGIEQTRQKYVRKNAADDVYADLPGLVIGKQTDKDTEFRNKRDAQAAYQQQLTADLRSKPVYLDRKAVDRRAVSPEPTQASFMSRIGDRSGNQSAEMEAAEARRRDAQRLLSTHRDDVLNRLNEANSPENKKYRERLAHGRVDEVVKFEEAPYRFIGGSVEAAKDKKKAMQEQYLNQLLQDNGPIQNPGRSNMHDPLAAYVNKTGYTGLSIGGHSRDEVNKNASQNEKLQKQAAYKRLLDQQRLQAEDLVRADRNRYGKY